MKITQTNIKDVFKSEKATVYTMELKGYQLIKECFVDNSGFGAENEPAMTIPYFIKHLEGIVKQHGQVYTTITNAGQFQVYIGVFKKSRKSMQKKIANNTYERFENGNRIIRFHDTDILEFNCNIVKLYNDGFFTVTTKQRLNSYLSPRYYVKQKSFKWYIVDNLKNETLEFTEGMSLAI